MVPVNPLRAVAESFTGCALPPAIRVRLDTFAETEKSAVLFVAVTPPQPAINPPDKTIAGQQNQLFPILDMSSAVLSFALEYLSTLDASPRSVVIADSAARIP